MCKDRNHHDADFDVLLASTGLAPQATMMNTGNSRFAKAAPTWKGQNTVTATQGKPKPAGTAHNTAYD